MAHKPVVASRAIGKPVARPSTKCDDSAITMGRIGWADGHARRTTGDMTSFNNLILDPIIGQVDDATWLPERYDCSGNPAHNAYYHEYPEMAVMLMREVRYGINLGLGTVTIDPLGGGRVSLPTRRRQRRLQPPRRHPQPARQRHALLHHHRTTT
jgi:hypothetical protein